MSKSSADESKMRIPIWLDRETRSQSPISGDATG